MSDEIRVRVTLEHAGLASTSRTTRVYAQIPEVARASWLLPAGMFAWVAAMPWPEALVEAHNVSRRQGWDTDEDQLRARTAVRDWLLVDENYAAMQSAYELDEARRHPVARKLLARVAELEKQLAEAGEPGPVVPRTERSYWAGIADALNAAHDAGMPVGIDLDGTLTDHRTWSVVWDRAAERWTVAGYDDEPDGIARLMVPVQALRHEDGPGGAS